MQYLIMSLVLWGLGHGAYLLLNKGIMHNAKGQQLRRYLVASILAVAPAGIVGADVCSPAMLMVLLTSLTWMISYPLMYHLTNRHASPEYDNHFDMAFGIYVYGWLSGLLIAVPGAGYFVGFLEFLLLMLPISLWIYYVVCKGCIDAAGMKMLQETHYNEIIEFIRSFHPVRVILSGFGIALVLACCVAVTISDTHLHGTLEIWQTIAVVALVLFFTVYLWKPKRGLFVRTGVAELYDVVKEYVSNNEKYISNMKQRTEGLQVTQRVKNDTPHSIFLVIGESASRDFMKAFNNSVDVENTPWMSNLMQNEKQCVMFPNAYACGTQTVPTLEKALTEYNQYDGGQFFTSCSIVDVAHKLGYKVHWYSNQGHLGAADTPITLVANTSEVAKWTKQELNKVQYDEALLDFLDEIDSECNNFVVLHLKGSHFNFENRFPEKNRQWGRPGVNDNIANYKNSIHYTDSVLQRFFDYGCKKLNMQAMVYLSDHGCSPKHPRERSFVKFMHSRIPLMVWMSERYMQLHPERAEALRANSGCHWTNDLLYELVCGVFDVESNHFKESNSLAHKEYSHTADTLLNGKIKLSEDSGIIDL